MDIMHKTCSKCGEQKPLEAFSPRKGGKYGRRSQCKVCRSVPHLREKREKQRLCEDHATEGEDVKFCFRCEECKSILAFSNSSKNADGKRSECKQCRSDYYFDNHEQATKRIHNYYNQNREHVKAYRRTYYRQNNQHENQRNRRYYRSNRSRITPQKRHYRRRKPEVKKATEHRRMARKRNLPDTFSDADWLRALEYFGSRCAVCGCPPDDNLKIVPDHWIPLASPDCPGTVPENIVPLCHGVGGCNNEKQHRPPEVWLTRKFGELQAKQKMAEVWIYFTQFAP